MKLGVGSVLSVLALAATSSSGQPAITIQPKSETVMLGATTFFEVSAISSAVPLRVQWSLNSSNLPYATNFVLMITNIQTTDAGDYLAVLTDGSGSVTSRVALLQVDTIFTKVTTGSIVTDIGAWAGCSWGDYDDDGFLDLMVTSSSIADPFAVNALYHNNRDGTFSRMVGSAPAAYAAPWACAAWADYDNDGRLDLLLTKPPSSIFTGYSSLS